MRLFCLVGPHYYVYVGIFLTNNSHFYYQIIPAGPTAEGVILISVFKCKTVGYKVTFYFLRQTDELLFRELVICYCEFIIPQVTIDKSCGDVTAQGGTAPG